MEMHKRAVLVCGGSIDKELLQSQIRVEDFVIGVDRGAQALLECQMKIDYMVGDFDSIKKEVLEHIEKDDKIPVRKFQPEKDASDTEIGLRFAIELGYKELILIGATGTRLDHVWANVQTLSIAKEYGVNAKIIDSYNQISLIDKKVLLKKEQSFGTCFSIFSLGGAVQGLTIKGAKYPVENVELTPINSLSVSNEFASDEVEITYKSGQLILMETRDE